MSAQPVEIQIFGRSLKINCPLEKQEALEKAKEDLEQRLQDLRERTKVTNTEQLVFIVGLNLCAELTQEKVKTDEEERKKCDYIAKMEFRITELQKVIDRALPK
ncbi:cell division protein ZapA [Candidatus Fukatsuia symbiotica]|uniref:Cell division protein ZapA n=1 Tax=Candidatus Fukatsuia symbiotica TaxID=1878942 RepID=A0A2U8I6B1_9GAMM|nr:cell division protein ZapA [Candidatus Fukatsuia symbiotica]AWK14723.1 Z-ring-associated protein [Candidatus Fukatsuia symbiotica]MEA9445053.1 cell division protein ZapA [Candidatus Fukatsuia symbiotica]